MSIKVVGIDLTKHFFQVCILSNENKITSNKKATRAKLLDVVRQFPEKTLIAMEACGSIRQSALPYTFSKVSLYVAYIVFLENG